MTLFIIVNVVIFAEKFPVKIAGPYQDSNYMLPEHEICGNHDTVVFNRLVTGKVFFHNLFTHTLKLRFHL